MSAQRFEKNGDGAGLNLEPPDSSSPQATRDWIIWALNYLVEESGRSLLAKENLVLRQAQEEIRALDSQRG